MTLEQVIKNYLIERGDNTKHGYQRLFQLAVNGINDLHIDLSPSPKVLKVSLNGNTAIPIPSDSLAIIGVDYPSENGKLGSFAKSTDLNMVYTTDSGTDIKLEGDNYANEQSASDWYNVADHYRNGENIGAYYNHKGGNPYLFRVNEQNNTIELSSNAPSVVFLKYSARPEKVNGAFEVHDFLLEPLLAWIDYADNRRKRGVSRNVVNDLQRAYVLQKTKLAKRLNAMTKADFLNAVNSGNTAIYKF